TIGDGDAEAADLADRLSAALEQIRVVVDEPVGAVEAAGLLVGDEGEYDVTARLLALADPVGDDGQRHRVHVLHVDSAAAPEAVVADLTGERIHLPVRGVGRYDVQVPVDQQRRSGGVDARPARDN